MSKQKISFEFNYHLPLWTGLSFLLLNYFVESEALAHIGAGFIFFAFVLNSIGFTKTIE